MHIRGTVPLLIILVGLLAFAGCATAPQTDDTVSASDAPDGGAGTSETGGADGVTADADAAESSVAELAEPVGPVVLPVSPDGVPLDEVLPAFDGLRLEYAVSRDGELTDEVVQLAFQPSLSQRADVSVHGAGTEGYAVMTESESLWFPTTTATDSPIAAVLAALPWPRFLPQDSETQFTFERPPLTATAEVAAPGEWLLSYTIPDDYHRQLAGEVTIVLAPVSVEPGPIDGGAPVEIVYTDASGATVTLDLTSAALYRERVISGVVVSAVGRPQAGFVVAPHPAIGRLPANRVARTGASGLFELPFRAAPRDRVRLFFGAVTGTGAEARIANPQEVRGRVGSPDFSTLIVVPQ